MDLGLVWWGGVGEEEWRRAAKVVRVRWDVVGWVGLGKGGVGWGGLGMWLGWCGVGWDFVGASFVLVGVEVTDLQNP